MDTDSLPPALQRLVDKDAIVELKHSFAWAIETNDLDLLADLFTEDATVNANPKHPLKGRAAIRARYTDVFGGWSGPFTSFHAVMNPRIQVEGDRASGTWYLLNAFLDVDPARGSPLQIVAVYKEQYRKVGGAWLIADLELDYLWTSGDGRITPANPMTKGR